MQRILKYDFCLILIISISILFWDSKDIFSNLRFIVAIIPFIFFFYYKKNLFFEIKENWKLIFIPTFLILSHYFFLILITGTELNYFSILKLFILFLFSISIFLSLNSLKKNFILFINISIILIFIFLVYDISVNLLNNKFFEALSVKRFESCYHGFFSEMSFIFKEESHFAIIMSPLLLTSIFIYLEEKNDFNLILLLTVIILLFTILFALSLTFIISFISFSVLSIFLAKNKKTRIIFLFLIISFFFTLNIQSNCANKLINITYNVLKNLDFKYIDNLIVKVQTYNQSKITNNPIIIHTGLSSGVYVNALKIAKNSISDFPLGVGFDNYEYSFFRYVDITSKDSSNLKEITKDLRKLNYNDGSNNFAKFTVEFGFLSIFFYIILIRFILNKHINTPMKIFIISSLITQIFLRGAGYFNGGFLILYLFAFYFQKTK
tara:strand:- start:932 stop:2242 length:1311 start_codon:yes stop_codon:yes gene_type:complete